MLLQNVSKNVQLNSKSIKMKYEDTMELYHY
jgi:hypothetical protein